MSATEPITLFIEAFWSSPFDLACHVALREKRLPFDVSRALVRDGQGVAGGLQKQALLGRVPALLHGSFWLTDSQAIVEYLEEVFPPPVWPRVLPADPRGRARARQVMAWLRSDLHRFRQARPSTGLFYAAKPGTPAPLEGEARREADELIDLAGRVVRDGLPFLFDGFTIADVDLAFALMRLIRAGDEVPARLAAWAEALWLRPSVREYVEHPRPPHPPG